MGKGMLQISCSGFGAENPGKREIAREQDARSAGLPAKDDIRHPWAVAGLAVVKAVADPANHTRLVSWLEPETLWHIFMHKRSLFFHRQAPVVNTIHPEGF
jgi:hypothetical protein